MADVAGFRLNPLLASFTEARFNDAIVGEFLSIAIGELTKHQPCLGAYFDRCCYLLTAHRLSRWDAENSASTASLSISELRNVVSNLSVSDEAGSESITFKPSSSSSGSSSKFDPDELESTTFGRLYLSIFEKYKCIGMWMVTGVEKFAPNNAPTIAPPTPIVPTGLKFGEFIVQFSYGDSTPKVLDLPITGIVDRVVLGINMPFNAPSSLSIGTANNPDLLMRVDQNLPTEMGQFESFPSANLISQQIYLTIAPGNGISQGFGFVLVEYSII